MATDELLRVEGLVKHFPGPGGPVRAVDGVSFTIARGETLGLVGESGSGKSTLARCVVRLIEPTAGNVEFDGVDLLAARGRRLRQLRRHFQIVFQDPYASLNPRRSVGDTVAAPLHVHRLYDAEGGDRRIDELFQLVGLDPAQRRRFPHELSGGQRQRVGIARALALNPKLLVLDEPVSSLDVSVRAQIIVLLDRLQRELGLTYLLIAHDLAVVRQLADRVAVMYLGKLMEVADRDQLFEASAHPYTQALLSAVPIPDPKGRESRRRVLLAERPEVWSECGCRFRPRCWKATQLCEDEEPALLPVSTKPQHCACHNVNDTPQSPAQDCRHEKTCEPPDGDHCRPASGSAPDSQPEQG